MVMGELPTEVEILVIGGGPGGYAAAFRAADLGLDVTLLNDEEDLGGVCLLRGCIPSKTLLYVAELKRSFQDASVMGLTASELHVDVEKLRSFEKDVIQELVSGLDHLCEQRGVHRARGRARFNGPRSVHVENGEIDSIEFAQAIIATGSRPTPLPGTEFGERIWDSARALALDEVPETLLVVGGGYVGLEMGTVYAALGSRVTVVEMTDQLLPGVDTDLVEPLAKRLSEVFEDVRLETEVAELSEDETEDVVRVSFEGDPEEQSFDRVLVSIGRSPRTESLGLETTDVTVNEDGAIEVDEERRTSAERVFAIGDVTGGHRLAHEAMREGKVVAEVLAGEPSAFDVRAVPAVVYTDPQVAWCGLTERQAEAEEREIRVARFPWVGSGRAASMGVVNGLTKVLVEADSDRVVGVGIVGRGAEALISEAVLAIEMGAEARDLAEAIHPHPTLSETLGEAAEVFVGGATHALLRSKES